MKISMIDLKSQYARIQADVGARMSAVLDHGQYIMGPEVFELEEKLAAYVGVPYCVGASSGTDTLLMALMAYGIGPGDEVITTSFTFISTGEVISLCGATPVFVDIDPVTFNLCPSSLESAVTEKTKAIMPVGLYGQCADMTEIADVGRRHGIPVIEDAAQSFGARYKSAMSCGLSEVGSTSFFPSKPLGCYGDGGALFTRDEGLAQLFRELRVHGQQKRYHHTRVGLNARLDSLQAAVVLAKLDIFDDEVEARQTVAQRYAEKLSVLQGKGLELPVVKQDRTSVFAQFTIRVNCREELAVHLKSAGIPTAIHYPTPLHQQPIYQSESEKRVAMPHSELASRQVLSLPMSPYLTESEQDYVVNSILEFFDS